MADLYFLWQHDVSPQLPHLLPGLVEDVADPSFLTMVETMVAGYQQAYAHLAEARPLWEAELILEFAQSLAALPQKQYARQQMERSMRTWLAVRQLAPGAPHDLYVQVISNLRPPDQQYLQALQRCRTVLRTEGEPPDALEAVP
jgi:hypothetical protein